MADRLDLEQLRKSLASGLMYPGPMQDAASFLLSLLDEGGRLVVEQPCEHGDWAKWPHYTDEGECPGGSRMQVWPAGREEQ